MLSLLFLFLNAPAGFAQDEGSTDATTLMTPSPGPSATDRTDEILDSAYQGGGAETTAAVGDNGNDNAELQEPVATVNTWDFISMIIGLLVVVGVIYLIFFALKRGMGKKIVENEQIKILGSRIITGNKALHVVDVGGMIFLVGSANDSINLIAEIAEKEAKDSIRLAASQSNVGKPRFAQLLASFFKPKVKRQLEINESVEFMKNQRDRLHKMKE